MTRLRYNNVGGTIQAALAATDTTITFSGGANTPPFATIVPPDYIPIVLNPPFGVTPASAFEVVHMTAYTAGATTGTIQRGQEGTTAQSHGLGVGWGVGPLAQDFAATALIASIVLGANGAIDFTGIPGTYNDLLLVGLLRTPRAIAQTNVGVRFNNDSGSNYMWQNLTGVAGTAAAGSSVGQNYGNIGGVSAAAAGAGAFTPVRLEIPGYALAANLKAYMSEWATLDPSSSYASNGLTYGMWNSSAAISRITFWDAGAASGNFATGSVMRLYGRN